MRYQPRSVRFLTKDPAPQEVRSLDAPLPRCIASINQIALRREEHTTALL